MIGPQLEHPERCLPWYCGCSRIEGMGGSHERRKGCPCYVPPGIIERLEPAANVAGWVIVGAWAVYLLAHVVAAVAAGRLP